MIDMTPPVAPSWEVVDHHLDQHRRQCGGLIDTTPHIVCEHVRFWSCEKCQQMLCFATWAGADCDNVRQFHHVSGGGR